MNFKVIGLIGALAFAVPMAAEAAPASGLTAQGYSTAAAAPAVATDAGVMPGDATAKVEKVWWRGGCCGWRGGWGGRRFGWGGGWGWRRPFYGYYGWRRPFWRRRFYY